MEREAQRSLSQGLLLPHLGDLHVGVGGEQRNSLPHTSQVTSQIVAWLSLYLPIVFLADF